MLEVGNGLTIPESRTHFAIWAAMKSPLLIGTDLSKFKEDDLEVQILKNKHLLAFNQDTVVGEPATPYKWGRNADWTFDDANPPEYWSGRSSVGTLALIINPENKSKNKTFKFSEIPQLQDDGFYRVTDVWTDTDLGCFADEVTFEIKRHDTVAIIVQDDCKDQSGRFDNDIQTPL
jgi:alpha-galactosidase